MHQARPHPPSGRSRSRRAAQRWWAEARVEQPAKHLPKLSRSQNARREPLMGRWAPLRGGCCQTCHAPLTFRGKARKFCFTACHTISRHPGFGTCEYCGDAFTLPAPSNRNRGEGRYCSHVCARKGASWGSPIHRRVLLALRASKRVRSIRLRRATCSECGISFRQATPGQVVCARETCKRRRAVRVAGSVPAGDVLLLECGGCGKEIRRVSKQGGVRTKCDRCERAQRKEIKRKRRRALRREGLYPNQSHRSRAKRHGVPYEPIRPRDVYERDRWRCGICGDRIGKAVAYPDPRSASVDCIVPMSRGGGFVMHNVQAAHWRCNVEKSDGAAGSQLRMPV